jgi:hypothetical protein
LEAEELSYAQIAYQRDRASSLTHEYAVHQLLLAGKLITEFDEHFLPGYGTQPSHEK